MCRRGTPRGLTVPDLRPSSVPVSAIKLGYAEQRKKGGYRRAHRTANTDANGITHDAGLKFARILLSIPSL